MQDRIERRSELGASVGGTPETLRSLPLYSPVQRKFHYKFKDGSSFILYLFCFLKEILLMVGNMSLQLTS